MSPTEVAYRTKKTLYMMAQKSGYFRAENIADIDISHHGAAFIEIPEVIPSMPYMDAADFIASGHCSVFAIDDADLGLPPRWNRDPRSGVVAPAVFGKTLNYRDPALVGDIKYLWEPNRHLQLVTLAQAYCLSKDEVYLGALKQQLCSWFEQCPYMIGPNWTSSLELGIRLINWSLTWQLIGGYQSPLFAGDDGDRFRNEWLKSVYQHIDFIAGHLSGFSSANNHLIGEVAGMFIASLTWPYWEECDSWQSQAAKILEREATKQNGADGVNLEQAVSYQQFVLDFLLLSGLCGRSNNRDFSPQYWQTIERMMEYLASIMDVNGNVPMIGDADDGYVVRLSQEQEWCPYRSLLATGAVLFKRKEFMRKAGSLDHKTLFLLDKASLNRLELAENPQGELPVHRAFSEGGYYLLGAEFETENEIRMLVDAGPLGYQGIAAHGHADALAFTLSISGLEFLIDPGTYAYHTQKKWRDYFRGTTAHNTVCVDGQDQSQSGGNFMWLRKATTVCEKWELGENMDRFVGSHDGYTSLSDPVLHRREIILHKLERKIEVLDTLQCEGKHKIQCFWHFSERCMLELEGGKVVATNTNKKIVMDIDGVESGFSLFSGDEGLPLGWVSRRYDIKEPTQVAVNTRAIEGTTTLRTCIRY